MSQDQGGSGEKTKKQKLREDPEANEASPKTAAAAAP